MERETSSRQYNIQKLGVQHMKNHKKTCYERHWQLIRILQQGVIGQHEQKDKLMCLIKFTPQTLARIKVTGIFRTHSFLSFLNKLVNPKRQKCQFPFLLHFFLPFHYFSLSIKKQGIAMHWHRCHCHFLPFLNQTWKKAQNTEMSLSFLSYNKTQRNGCSDRNGNWPQWCLKAMKVLFCHKK